MVTTREASLTCSNTPSYLLSLSISSANQRRYATSILTQVGDFTILVVKWPLRPGNSRRAVGSLEFEDFPAQLQVYGRLIESYLSQVRYPGSPLIAADLLRPQDELKLFELHSTEAPRLQALFARDSRIRVSPTNGFLGLPLLLPVQHARALVLIDPPYELAADYTDAVTSLKAAYLRMSNGVFALWYPVIDGAPHLPMLNSIKTFVDSKLWHFELAVRDESVRGEMSSTGMLVINPPWTLATDLERSV